MNPQYPNPFAQPQLPPPPPAPRRSGGLGCFLAMVILGIFVASLYLLNRSDDWDSDFVPVLSESVGVVRIEEPIDDSKAILKVIKSFRKDKNIKAIVVRLDTPGGRVGASEEIYRELKRVRELDKKPVVASMGNAAASGGYYIAAGAEEIYANAGTITGSIGVIAPGFNVEDTLKKLGIESVTIKSGEHKDTGSPFREARPEDKRLLQGVIFDMYRQFFTTVLRARHKQIDEVLAKRQDQFDEVADTSGTKNLADAIEWNAFTTGTVASVVGASQESETALRRIADGRILTGDQAMKVGLVDHIGNLHDATERAAILAGLGKDAPVVDKVPGKDLPLWFGASAGRFWREAVRARTSVEMREEGL